MVQTTQFYVLLLLLVSVSGQRKLYHPCTLAHGKPGRCIRLEGCPKIAKLAAQTTLYDREMQKLRAVLGACNSDENSSDPIVCCETTLASTPVPRTTQSSTTSMPYGNNLQKALPAECGRIKVRKYAWNGVPDEHNIHVWSVFLNIQHTQTQSNGRCVGTLIHERVVLTAAHCVRSSQPDNVKLYFGLVLYSELQECLEEAICQERQAAEIIIHPNYNYHAKVNDLALIGLNEAVNFTERVGPACLPLDHLFDESSANDHRVISLGWGEYEDGPTSDIKRIVPLRVLEQNICKDKLRSNQRFNVSMIYSVMCTKGIQDEQDVCEGDSGAALLQFRNEQFFVVGVVSFGPKCGTNTGESGVATRVSEYQNWILGHLKRIHDGSS